MLDPRSVALQGLVGPLSVLAIATQGFFGGMPSTVEVVDGGGGTLFKDAFVEQLHQEDEIIILAVAQCFAHGVFT